MATPSHRDYTYACNEQGCKGEWVSIGPDKELEKCPYCGSEDIGQVAQVRWRTVNQGI